MKTITAKEAAQILNVGRSQISNLIKKGTLIIRNNGITFESVENYKNNRPAPGRPLGSFKYN